MVRFKSLKSAVFITNLKNKEIEFDFHKKINYGLPFGIIFITSNSDNPIDIDNKTKKLESCFRDTIKHLYCPFTIGNYLILDNLSCFIFQNDSSFNLKQYLLGLKEKLGFELKFHFRHQKIIHHYMKYMDILKEK